MSVHLTVQQCTCLSLSVYLFVSVSDCRSVCLSVCVFIASSSEPSADELEAVKDELDIGAEADVEDA